MYGTVWALLPPIIAITLALLTKEVYSSLFIGIVAGALLVNNFAPVATVDTIINDGFIGSITDAANAGIFLFLVLLGIIVALMNKAGGSAAFGRWAQEHVKTRAGAMLATFALGILIFVDDYFNCLTVGAVMQPVSDSHRISRAKLAWIIDATAAPICMIAPISSWATAVSGVVDEGVMSGMELFVRAIPWNYYSLLTLVFIVGIALMGFDYGPMKIHERNAREKGDLFTTGEFKADTERLECNPKGRVMDLVIPVVILVASCVGGLLYKGGFFDGASVQSAFADTDVYGGLPWGALLALLAIAVYYMVRGLVSFKEACGCVTKGFITMVPALTILTFAITLKTMTGMLGADVFVAGLMEGASATLYNMLPAIIFLVACGLAFSTGTSWGTFSILIPIVTGVFPVESELLIIGVSACLAGAVMGDHCSPISDTTIMSSAGAQCDHVNHVATQIPYVLTVAAVSFVCFIIAGFVQNAVLCLAIGVVLTIATLFVLRQLTRDEAAA